MKDKWILLIILLTFAVGSCSPSLSSTAELTPVLPSVEPRETPSQAPLLTSLPESSTQEGEPQLNPSLPIPARTDPQTLIEEAREDLAERESISVKLIHLVEIDEVSWPDASLGCPQAGNTYAQTQTPGYLVKLTYAGDEFEYHANLHGFFFYCENPTPPISATPVDINP
jgi:hypothetical protein